MFTKSEDGTNDKSELKEVQNIPEPTSVQFDEIEEEESDYNENEEQSRPTRTRRPPDHYGEWVYLAENDTNEPKSVSEAMSSNEKKEWMNAM